MMLLGDERAQSLSDERRQRESVELAADPSSAATFAADDDKSAVWSQRAASRDSRVLPPMSRITS